LAKLGYVIVTGLARGIDAAAHRGAISVKGKTVGVLPWIHEPYPPEHTRLMHETKENGCIISEHFFQSPKYDRYKFLQRNAVISGISELLIAVESSFTGGTRWQVELAISQKKPVIAIEPEKSNTQAYDGYLKFLEKGAIGASTHEDVLEIVRNKVQLLEQVVGEELESSSMMKMGYSAIMNAFRALELHITELAAVRGLASPFEIEQAIQFLVKTGLLNRSDKEKFESIRNLRNAYLHSNNLVSVGDVKSFLDTAEKLDMKLEDALLRGRIDKFL
jgi:DNA processing protein